MLYILFCICIYYIYCIFSIFRIATTFCTQLKNLVHLVVSSGYGMAFKHGFHLRIAISQSSIRFRFTFQQGLSLIVMPPLMTFVTCSGWHQCKCSCYGQSTQISPTSQLLPMHLPAHIVIGVKPFASQLLREITPSFPHS